MPENLDPAVAEYLVQGAMCWVPHTYGNKITCTKRELERAMLRLAEEAYAMGYLSDQKEKSAWLAELGAAERPAWMSIQLDAADLAKYGIRLQPIVLRSLNASGYHGMGDLCWLSEYELGRLFYVGRVTARLLRNIIRQFQSGSPHSAPTEGNAKGERPSDT